MAESIVNLTHLKALLGHDDRMVSEFLEIFKEEIPGQLEAIRQALQIKDWSVISHTAHSIKSQLKYLDLNDLATLAVTIESYADSRQHAEDISALFNQLETGLQRVMDRL